MMLLLIMKRRKNIDPSPDLNGKENESSDDKTDDKTDNRDIGDSSKRKKTNAKALNENNEVEISDKELKESADTEPEPRT